MLQKRVPKILKGKCHQLQNSVQGSSLEAILEWTTWKILFLSNLWDFLLSFQGRKFQLNVIFDERIMTKVLKRRQTIEFLDSGSKSHI